jgi:hypothetical protein
MHRQTSYPEQLAVECRVERRLFNSKQSSHDSRIAQIVHCFQGYLVPMQLTPEKYEARSRAVNFFNQGVEIYAANAFEVPGTLPTASLNDLLTIFLNTSGSGGILNVIKGTGGSSTIANPDVPVTVVSYP